MAAVAFDSLHYARQLEAAGMPREQAEVVAKGLTAMFVHNFDSLVTKDYLDTRFDEQGVKLDLLSARIKDNDEIRFLFTGGGAERAGLEQRARERKLGNVVMMPRQPKEMMPAVWSLCDISLISLRDTPLFTKVIPSKIFESMGMGLPMVIACPEGEATGIIRDTNSGVVVPPENPRLLADSLASLHSDRKKLRELAHASAASARDYDRARQARLMLESLESAVSG